MLLCTKCNTKKPPEAFSNKSKSPTGKQCWCKACMNAMGRARYAPGRQVASQEPVEVISLENLALECKLNEAAVKAALDASGKKPLSTMVNGKSTLVLYPKTDAMVVINKHLVAEAAAKASALAKAAKVTPPSTPPLNDVMVAISNLAKDIPDLHAILPELARVQQQNVLLFKALSDLTTLVNNGFAKLSAPTSSGHPEPIQTPVPRHNPEPIQTPVPRHNPEPIQTPVPRHNPEPIQTPVPRHNPEPIQTPRPNLLKVGIVGTFAGEERDLDKEFGDVLKLTMLTPDDFRKIPGLKNIDPVLFIPKRCSHKHHELLMANGVKPVMIEGSLNALKSKLIEIYVKHADAMKAQPAH